MSRLIFAIALFVAVQAATADAAPPAPPAPTAATATAAVAVAAAGVVQASMGLPEKEAKGTSSAKPATVKASLESVDSKEGDDAHRPTTGAMLLAALALMTGIVLRRWGAGQQ